MVDGGRRGTLQGLGRPARQFRVAEPQAQPHPGVRGVLLLQPAELGQGGHWPSAAQEGVGQFQPCNSVAGIEIDCPLERADRLVRPVQLLVRDADDQPCRAVVRLRLEESVQVDQGLVELSRRVPRQPEIEREGRARRETSGTAGCRDARPSRSPCPSSLRSPCARRRPGRSPVHSRRPTGRRARVRPESGGTAPSRSIIEMRPFNGRHEAEKTRTCRPLR